MSAFKADLSQLAKLTDWPRNRLEELERWGDRLVISISYLSRRELLIDLVNFQGAGASRWFLNKWADSFWLLLPDELPELRDQLRRIWVRGTEEAGFM
jgi:hypothetical protein